jgi:hypothetical protein
MYLFQEDEDWFSSLKTNFFSDLSDGFLQNSHYRSSIKHPLRILVKLSQDPLASEREQRAPGQRTPGLQQTGPRTSKTFPSCDHQSASGQSRKEFLHQHNQHYKNSKDTNTKEHKRDQPETRKKSKSKKKRAVRTIQPRPRAPMGMSQSQPKNTQPLKS